MRLAALVLGCALLGAAHAAEVESRVLTHYVPQDFLETMVRSERWVELPLNVAGGLRKDDVVRIWAGGSIDWGNGDQPGQNVSGPTGLDRTVPPDEVPQLALRQESAEAFAVLFKTDTQVKKCQPPGKPLELTLTKDKEQVWIGFNDRKGHYYDNHLGKGRRHEFDPLWIRIEVVRIIVD